VLLIATVSRVSGLPINGSGMMLTASELRRQTRETYDGPLALGEDLMRFVIGETVEVLSWSGRP
jgi:hypothetical protein